MARPKGSKNKPKMIDASSNATQKRIIGRPIQKGQVLNPKGRAPGSRNKLSEDFLKSLCDSFQEHGKIAIKSMLDNDPSGYIKVVASLIPKDMNVKVDVSDQFVAAWKALSSNAT